ncbi:hypothetical protein M406DRAFT_342224 [Cryphonectria parasitica EP155]|uniref:X-Pro dipeptidyl-peptidase n=1 Tax=Cryphonectria parasitica (strain ATCC 38755 / EP155) TaxID=660469 RepID=A0A9P4XUV8_CRYP1|nr:uncharacterized protein M406DRAFT_342224 [Cryphonectria parasitica EP155]KAF3761429.1 hypothetical protein M406DRAFT_342224 [Cryphonectria parasitica EP155]
MSATSESSHKALPSEVKGHTWDDDDGQGSSGVPELDETWDAGWEDPAAEDNISLPDRINRFAADEKDLKNFWSVTFSPRRYKALTEFYTNQLTALAAATPSFDALDQESQVDYLLLQNHIQRSLRRRKLEARRDSDAAPLLPFAPPLVELCEARQACDFDALDPKHIAAAMHDATGAVVETQARIVSGRLQVSKEAAYQAIKNIENLLERLADLYGFFRGFQPSFDWWVQAPYSGLTDAIQSLVPIIATKLAGMRSHDSPDEIIGEPIGKAGLLVELEAEMIPYSPRELLAIANQKYEWCEKEMKKAASELGFGDDWKAALRHVQNIYVEPGEQPQLVQSLIGSATTYVKQHDLVTVPPLAEKTWRMFMMTPAAQKVNPFFLGGPSIIVSYPTAAMAHADKLMSMRGNGPHLSKATAFHEMIPGHHLQLFVGARARPYRRLFDTPFYTEGWAMYWELVLWDRGDFFTSPEDRVGTLFWRMHRCARILFSIRFHLGLLTPRECVDLLVDMVGHERATAEGEVRRSLAGDYSPLYQAGYFLGAMQLYALRQEILGEGDGVMMMMMMMGEKAFHDRVLAANQMPIELLRALIRGETLSRDYKSKWKFYDDVTELETEVTELKAKITETESNMKEIIDKRA